MYVSPCLALTYIVNTYGINKVMSGFKSGNYIHILLFIGDWKVEGAIVESLYLVVGMSFKKQETDLFDLHSLVVSVLARVKVIMMLRSESYVNLSRKCWTRCSLLVRKGGKL